MGFAPSAAKLRPSHGRRPGLTIPFFLLCGLLRAAGVTSDSGDTEVDTRRNAIALTVTMHRATAEVLENANASAGIDEPLRVKGTNRTLLAAAPALPGVLNPDHRFGALAKGGLVADGVTPLLFKLSLPGRVAATSATYDLEIVQVAGGLYRSGADLMSKVQILNGAAFAPGRQITFGASEQTAFAVLGPVDSADLDTKGFQDEFGTAAVICDLVVREAITHREAARYEFGIRKPPILLVHGFNSDASTWGSPFVTAAVSNAASLLASDRGSNFVRAIDYGVTKVDGIVKDREVNTYYSLSSLIGVLDAALSAELAQPWSADWAFSRYDVVGHSQGGVLLRLLCSENPGQDMVCSQVPAFRNAGNAWRDGSGE